MFFIQNDRETNLKVGHNELRKMRFKERSEKHKVFNLNSNLFEASNEFNIFHASVFINFLER